MTSARLAVIAGALFTLSLGSGRPSPVATITVSTFDDELNDDDDCSLREALRAANEDAAVSGCPRGEGADIIDVPPGTYTLTLEGRAEDAGLTGDLDITSDVTIRGAGAGMTVVQACAPIPPESICTGIDRVFHVDPAGTGVTTTISGMTIQNGSAVVISFVDSSGGAVFLGVPNTLGDTMPSGTLSLIDSVVRNSSTPRYGGGIANKGGTLIMTRSTVSGNSAGTGGGISNFFVGTVIIEASTLRGNSAGDGGGFWSTGSQAIVRDSTVSGNIGFGIAIHRQSLITNTTVSGNSSDGLFLFNDSGGGPHTLRNCTITNNGGNGIQNSHGGLGSGPVTVNNTIAAANGGFDCVGTLMSTGHNLIQRTTAPFSNPSCFLAGNADGNIIGAEAKLGLLADNGGPTKTHALLAGSPAIDAGSPALPGSGGDACEATDQRGQGRPLGPACDIGAFEARRDFSISGMLPNTAGNSAPTLSLIYGSGFVAGATVKLSRSGQNDLIGRQVAVDDTGSVIAATIDLTGVPTGVWDLQITNLGGAIATRTAALTVTESAAAQVWMDVLGPPAMRTGRATTFRILVGNRGDVDAFAVPLVVTLPGDYAWGLRFPLVPPPAQLDPAIDWNDVPINATPEVPGTTVVFLLIPVVPAGFTGVFELSLTAPQDGEYEITYEIGAPYFEHGVKASVLAGLSAIARDYAREALQVEVPESRLPDIAHHLTTQLEGLVAGGQQSWIDGLGTRPDAVALTHLLIDAAVFASRLAAETADPENGDAGNADGGGAALPFADCTQIARQGGVLLAGQMGHGTGDCRSDGKKKKRRRGPVGRSHDPNDKTGSQGTGDARYVAGGEPLRYAIAFENVESATFPAQEVVITDQLDLATVDLSTFSLGPMSFADRQVLPPPGLQAFLQDIDLRPDKPYAVRAHAALDTTSGIVTWRFATIDPATGELPEDPRIGFLPPNVTSPDGEGTVLFTVEPKPNLSTGAEIANAASIVFDDNTAIETPPWRNTIDRTPPTSAVLALPATTTSATFEVRWAGNDDGAGIADYTIAVSEDGGLFTTWLQEVTDAAATFTGRVGARYAFYSIARDYAGNSEASPVAGDAQTRIAAPCPGDCDTSGNVTVSELVTGVNIALNSAGLDRCPSFDRNTSGTVTVDELIAAVNAALRGCP